MPRTTLDLDAPVLRELKRLKQREHKSLGRLASDLLAQALGRQRAGPPEPPPFEWISRPMQARVDLSDKEALNAELDRS